MSSPFPGMDLYLENPEIWPSVHNRLIVALADALTPQVVPKYFVDIEQIIYEISGDASLLVGIPDVTVQGGKGGNAPLEESAVAVASPPTPMTVDVPMPERIKQSYLEVRERESQKVIAAIDILSPVNKTAGRGREKYESKRLKILGSSTHLIEIDLLRSGAPMRGCEVAGECDYRILVSGSDRRPKADLYAFIIRHQLPQFSLPLQREDAEPIIDLPDLLNQLYDRARYDLRLDYTQDPILPFSKSDRPWVDARLRAQNLR
ncbi:DUF4058 family protein [Phormidium sp. CCY1219]|uniref:DUF4058 family protein n=1 Tax=Phormidium sp. CCY1219 TaxID=2886104 RepID=UPI002D1E5FD8|nr:DUF4058 family protein [Phormidium sp. CCY1219]MEB3828390.1 DUF4058 family protein [Phormidium sp. CCY1219]